MNIWDDIERSAQPAETPSPPVIAEKPISNDIWAQIKSEEKPEFHSADIIKSIVPPITRQVPKAPKDIWEDIEKPRQAELRHLPEGDEIRDLVLQKPKDIWGQIDREQSGLVPHVAGVNPEEYKRKASFLSKAGRGALAVLGADENIEVYGMRKALGLPPEKDYLNNTWTNLYIDKGVSEPWAQGLGLATAILTSPFSYIKRGITNAVRIGEKSFLSERGLSLATKVSNEKTIADAAKAGVVEGSEGWNAIARKNWQDTQKELSDAFSNVESNRAAIKISPELKEASQNVFHPADIQLEMPITHKSLTIVPGEWIASTVEKMKVPLVLKKISESSVGKEIGSEWDSIKSWIGVVPSEDRPFFNWVKGERRSLAFAYDRNLSRVSQWFKGMSPEQVNEFSKISQEATLMAQANKEAALEGAVGEKLFPEIKVQSNDPVVQERLDRWFGLGKHQGKPALQDRLAKYAKLAEDEKLDFWTPLISQKYAEQAKRYNISGFAAPKREFNVERFELDLKNIEEGLKQRSGLYLTNPIESWAIRRTQAQVANLQERVYQRAIDLKLGGLIEAKTADQIDSLKKSGYVELVPPSQARAIAKLEKGDLSDTATPSKHFFVKEEFGKGYNKLFENPNFRFPVLSYMMDLFKSHVTSSLLNPAFFVGQSYSNLIQNSYKMGSSALGFTAQTAAARMTFGKGLIDGVNSTARGAKAVLQKTMSGLGFETGTAIKDILTGINMDRTIVTKYGEHLKLQNIYDEMTKLGVIKTGYYMQDLYGETLEGEAKGFVSNIFSGLNPLNPNTFIMTKYGRKVGSAIEDQARAVNYITHRMQGMNPPTAAMEAIESLFDYADITKADSAIKNLVYPFWVFDKKNLEYTARMFSRRPVIVTAQLKVLRDFAPTDAEWEMLPESAKKNWATKIGSWFLGDLRLPLVQGMQLFENPGEEIVQRSSPILKYLFEAQSGKDIRSGRELQELDSAKEFEGIMQIINKKDLPDYMKLLPLGFQNWLKLHYNEEGRLVGDYSKLHILRTLPTSRYESAIALLSDKDRTWTEFAVKWLTGLYALPVDDEIFTKDRNKRAVREMGDRLRKESLVYMHGGKIIGAEGLTENIKKKRMEKITALTKKMMTAQDQDDRDDIMMDVGDLIEEWK